MTRIALYAGGDLDVLETDFDVFVGVDAGSLFLLQHQLPLDMVIGDFDSVSPADFQQIEQAAKELIQAPAEKDDTDLELALKTVFERYPQAQARVFGALGGRIDHLLSNLFLASDPGLAPFMEQMELVGADNRILFRPAGQHRLSPIEGMTYISFMPSDGSHLTIENAKYPLREENFFFKKCYSSNEFLDGDIQIALDTGYVVIIYSKDRS
ncbi:thiamine diphosphokinase [Streptococcus sp.]|uniref:thiamine diphosphokinase n=1 Tax=Streptococcus sp. TaxID=1306 RepID=UPI0035A191AB